MPPPSSTTSSSKLVLIHEKRKRPFVPGEDAAAEPVKNSATKMTTGAIDRRTLG
jgi:hypothetical protein